MTQFETDDVLRAFNGSLPLNLKILREIYHAQSIELMPERQSPFYIVDPHGIPLSLFLPIDSAVGFTALRFDKWDPRKQEFMGIILNSFAQNVALVDVGSNVGLFARQCLSRLPSIKKAYCYEPNPHNFKLLRRNLIGLPDIDLNNCGLSNDEGTMDLYLDPNNAGNYSLNQNAMPETFISVKVDIKSGASESRRWMEETDIPFLYKSDTQGFDEIISTALDEGFWQRVKAGVFELWRLPGKKYDPDKFAEILDRFPNKVFETKPSINVTSADVIDYLSKSDMQHDDLYFWQT